MPYMTDRERAQRRVRDYRALKFTGLVASYVTTMALVGASVWWVLHHAR